MHAATSLVLGAAITLLTVSASGQAATPRPTATTSSADRWTVQPIYAAKDKIVVPVGKAATTHTLDIPTIDRRDGQRVCMRFKAYLESPAPGGWNPYLTIAINDRPLGPELSSGEDRLINRGQSCETKNGRLDWWGRNPAGDEALLTFFGLGTVLDDRIIKPRDEPYWYVLDISDAVNYVQIGADGRTESAKPNKIVLSNTCLKEYMEQDTAVHRMVIEDLTIGYLSEDVVARHQLAALVQYKGTKEKERLDGDDFSVVVTESGGIRIDVKQDRYYLASSFSYPGRVIGYNRFDPDASPGQEGWQPRVRKIDRQTIRIEAVSPQYEVARTLSLRDGRLRVSDQFTNTTDAPIGVLICNSLAIADFPKPGRYFLGGLESHSAPVIGSAENPTVFVAQAHSSVGLVAEDNLYRLQLGLSRRANVFDMTAGHFGLDAKKACTLEWTIYPRTHQDYWSFINEVRRDWNVNFTIPGPFAYGGLEKGRKTAIACIGPWMDYDDGAGITREQYKATWAKAVAKLRKDDPNLIVMPKIENNLVAINKQQVPGGEILPASKGAKGGQYGLELTKEQTAVLANTPFGDSVLRTADGRMIVDTFYAKEPYINLLVHPVKSNARYKAYFEQIDFLMDQVGYNGIYIDQFSLGWGAMDRMDRRTMDKWDGHSVDIDEKTGQVLRKYTDCALAGADARADVLNYILRKGGKVVANSFPCVRETQSLRVFRFAEMENDPLDIPKYLKAKPPAFASQAKGHLASPIVLGVRPEQWGKVGKAHWSELITKAVITGLRNGLLYYYYEGSIPGKGPGAGDYGPVNHMFPFTPVELHSGCLVGQERIIACVSADLQWQHKEAPVCHRFDLKGREIPHGFQMSRQGDGWLVKVALDDWNEIAVLEESNQE